MSTLEFDEFMRSLVTHLCTGVGQDRLQAVWQQERHRLPIPLQALQHGQAHHITGSTLSLSLLQVWGKTGSKLYGKKSGSDYIDNQQRFKLFNKAAFTAMTSLPFSPGTDTIVVCNDWHTALLPVLLKVQEGCLHAKYSAGTHLGCNHVSPYSKPMILLVSIRIFIIEEHGGRAACCRKCSGCEMC